jgi:glutamate synthase (NADPH/NADH) large chain
VDLETIDDATEEKLVRDLIERHAHFTDSARARVILDSWNSYREKLVKIMPLDYRRVLAERQQKTIVMVQHG